MAITEIRQALALTCELTGTDLSPAAMHAMAAELGLHPESRVLEALRLCRLDCRHRLTLADVFSRIDDGRPEPDEAWAKVPRDEAVTVVWTDEIRQAWAAAAPLIELGEEISGRMAFLQVYRREVQRARDEHRKVNWTVSLGHDQAGREGPLRAAAERGQLTHEHVQGLLPHYQPAPRTNGLVHVSKALRK